MKKKNIMGLMAGLILSSFAITACGMDTNNTVTSGDSTNDVNHQNDNDKKQKNDDGAVDDAVDGVTNGVDDTVNGVGEGVEDAVDGVTNGVEDAVDGVTDGVKKGAEDASQDRTN